MGTVDWESEMWIRSKSPLFPTLYILKVDGSSSSQNLKIPPAHNRSNETASTSFTVFLNAKHTELSGQVLMKRSPIETKYWMVKTNSTVKRRANISFLQWLLPALATFQRLQVFCHLVRGWKHSNFGSMYTSTSQRTYPKGVYEKSSCLTMFGCSLSTFNPWSKFYIACAAAFNIK